MKALMIEIDNDGEYEDYRHHTYRCFLTPDQTSHEGLLAEFEEHHKPVHPPRTYAELKDIDRFCKWLKERKGFQEMEFSKEQFSMYQGNYYDKFLAGPEG